MKAILIQQLTTILLSMLSPEMLKIAADKILDIVEDAVMNSETKVDDAVILPLCSTLRATFDIPDND